MAIQQKVLSVFAAFLHAALFQISSSLAVNPSNDDTQSSGVSSPTSKTPLSTTTAINNDVTTVQVDKSDATTNGNFLTKHFPDSSTMSNAFYVVIGVTVVIVVLFVIRAVRLRYNRSKKTRYGLLSTRDDHLEMRHLEEDDDDDATVFDRTISNSHR